MVSPRLVQLVAGVAATWIMGAALCVAVWFRRQKCEVAVGELTNIRRAWRESQHEIRALRGWLQASEAENARACARIGRTAGNLRKS